MKNHNWLPVGYGMGSARYHCYECGAYNLDMDPPHHFPSWRSVSSDCDEAREQIRLIELDMFEKSLRNKGREKEGGNKAQD